jgi:hypothetical protein
MAQTPELLVLQALEKALLQDGEIRLVKSRTENGLFADRRGMRAAAIEQCLSGDSPLLGVVRTEKRGRNTVEFVTLNPDGLNFLVSKVGPAKAKELLKTSLQRVTSRLKGVQDHMAGVHAARDLVQHLVASLETQIRVHALAMEEGVREFESRLARLPSDGSPLDGPATEADFGRRALQQMVFAWQEADSTEARAPIERALLNSEAVRIGKPGEQLQFVGRLHECHEPVFPGDPVEIVQPGWLMLDSKGEYLLAKAKVIPLPSAERA